MEQLGVAFETLVPDVEELREGDPSAVVLENARRKARAGAREGTLVIGVDTDVAIDGRLLGKPDDEAGARERLETLSGRVHEVLSGVVILGEAEACGVARTEVRFRELDEPTIALYVASREWEGRAGAYAIQGLGSILIDEIRGDFSNVVGLPIALLLQLAPNLLERPENPQAKN